MPWSILLFVFSDITLNGALGNVVDNAFFASLSQLKALWQNEVDIVQMLRNVVDKCENPPTSVTMYDHSNTQ